MLRSSVFLFAQPATTAIYTLSLHDALPISTAVGGSIRPAKAANCVAAGFLSDSAGWNARMNSAGNFGYHRSTNASFSVTVRSEDGTGSGYGADDTHAFDRMDTEAASAIALEKAVASRNPRAIEPGKYTVIREPLA